MAGEISARFHRRGAADQSRPLPAGSPGDADRVADQTKASELSRELLCISAAEAGAGAVAAALLRATAGGHREAEGIRAPLRRRTTGARSQGPRISASATTTSVWTNSIRIDRSWKKWPMAG